MTFSSRRSQALATISVAAPLVLLLAAATPAVAQAGTASRAAAPLGTVSTPLPCSGLTLTAAAAASPAAPVQVFATTPRPLSHLALASTAFSAARNGRVLPTTATSAAGAGTAVAVVLAADLHTPGRDYLQARAAARELLVSLPPGARTALIDGSGTARVLSPLSPQREFAAFSLGQLERPVGARSTAQAVLLAAQQLPAGGHVVVLSDTADDADPAAQLLAAAALAQRGVLLDRLTYGAAGGTATAGVLQGDGCVAATAGQSLISRVDTVVSRLQGEYRLNISSPSRAGITVTVAAAGVRAQATLPAAPAPAGAPAAPQQPTAAPPQAAPQPPVASPASSPPSHWWSGPSPALAVALLLACLLAGGAWWRGRARRVWPPHGEALRGTTTLNAPGKLPYTADQARPAGAGPVAVSHRGGGVYPDVDVAIVQESTYPYLKGGVSAVVHDIVQGNQDLTFGIIHIAWDTASPTQDLYGMPDNVRWVRPVYLSMQEHREDFSQLTPADLNMSAPERTRLSHRLFDALHRILDGDMTPMWQLYDEGMNPRTRAYPIWAILGSKEFMTATRDRLPGLGLPLVATFWLLREFFSLACAVAGGDMPKAGVYHAHTTGYASLLAAAAARQNDTSFLLTEHNLYVRDTVNVLLERSMALTLTVNDWREFDVTATERAWMAWWIEMGRFCYPSAEAITYLYPKAVVEAADLGAPVEKSVVIPNGMIVRQFEGVSEQRRRALPAILADDPQRVWRLVYIARVVPIKGLADLIETVALLVERGITNFHLDILGPTDHHPGYYMLCREKARALRVEDYLTFRGTVQVRDLLGEFDVLVLPSYNEGQPIVVLEAMTAGIPTVGTEVGGMAQLIDEPLTTPGGHTWGPCGLLVRPEYIIGMADALQTLMRDSMMYAEFAANARGRISDFFQLEDAMGAYNRLYRELGGLEQVQLEGSQTGPAPATIDLTEQAGVAPGVDAQQHATSWRRRSK